MLSEIVAATSGSSDGVANFGFVFLLSGFIFYGLMFMRYRNINRRHHHETETEVDTANARNEDRKVDSVRGATSRRMRGANNTRTGAAQRRFWTLLPAQTRWIGRYLR